MTDSIEQRRKGIKEARNKLLQSQICKMKSIYEYTCEFRKWYCDAPKPGGPLTTRQPTEYS